MLKEQLLDNEEISTRADKSAQKQELVPNNSGKVLGPKNLFQGITYSYLNRVVDTGASQPYQNEMLYDVGPELCYIPDQTSYHKKIFTKDGKITMWSIFSKFLSLAAQAFFFSMLGKISFLLIPLQTKVIIQWLGKPEACLREALPAILTLSASFFILAYCNVPRLFNCLRIKLIANNALSIIITKKLLKLPPTAKLYLDYGKLAVMVNSDIEKVSMGAMHIMTILNEPPILIIACLLMYREIGIIFLIPVCLVIITLSLQRVFTRAFTGMDKERRKLVDKKSNMVTETVSGMKNVKFNAWEYVMKSKSVDIRKKEKGLLRWLFLCRSLIITLIALITPICCLSCFSIFYFYGNGLDISSVFALIMLFGFIQTPLDSVSRSIFRISSSLISLRRLNVIAALKDYEPENVDGKLPVGAVSVKSGNFSWDDSAYKSLFKSLGGQEKEQKENSESNKRQPPSKGHELDQIFLKDINLEARSGQFISIIGKVSSGKSSLLHSILDSMKTVTGSVAINGEVAFIPQESFLVNDTLKNNILFGKPYDEEWYYKVIDACELDADIAMLPGKEQTEIGERGINLSGGQRQRIAIARAVYSQSDIYLIDDSLSALDAEVGHKILEGVFMGLLRDKTVIMVTNHLFFLEKTDEILVMKDGRIATRGDYQTVRGSPEYAEILEKKHQLEKEEEDSSRSSATFSVKYSKHVSKAETAKLSQEEKLQKEAEKKFKQVEKDKRLQGAGKLTQEEKRSVGIVGWKIYFFYLRLAGGGIFSSLIIFSLISTFFQLGVNVWAGKWAQHSFESLTNQDYFWIYLGLIISFFLMSATKYHFFALMISKCSYKIFTEVFWNILRRPMSFFDTTHSGVIINRCTDDIEIADFNMPITLIEVLTYTFSLLGSFIVAGISTPIILVIMLPVMFFLGKYLEKYLRTSTELRRLSRLSRSPILTTISELVNGLTSIRIYGYQGKIAEKWRGFHNTSQKIALHECYARYWILWKSELTLLFVYIGVYVLVVLGKVYKFNATQDPAVLGMLMSAVFSIGRSFFRFLIGFGELANSINVIERLKEYIEDDNFVKDFDSPKVKEVSGGRGLATWPSEGRIEARDVVVRYRAGLPNVLNGLSFQVVGGDKVGVVGRTGSGKSTLILCLMRILELEDPTGEGSILIDGVNIGRIGLHELRKKLTIIPQEPYIVEGTLRFNIDPLDEYTDSEVIAALEKVDIFTTLTAKTKEKKKQKPRLSSIQEDPLEELATIKALPNPSTEAISKKKKKELLNYFIEIAGKNLSQGQKQLICIARALVGKPKILLMDEATSSIDQKSDAIVQRVIKKELNETTVISIAHRLVTIIQYDQLLVLKNGVKVEQGSPLTLINNGGYFCSLVEEGGKDYKKKMIYCAKNREVDPSRVL